MLKFFRLPFATTGDKTAVPDAVDLSGNVSYSQGYGLDYQRQKTDPAAKNIERDKMNQIFFDMTTAIAEIQSQGVPDFITTALNGGTAYSYGLFAVVKYSGDLYISLAATNTALPSDATKWALLPTPARIQASYNSSVRAGGTGDAIVGSFTPTITALPASPGTLLVFVRALGANLTATPTFRADSTAAKVIVKGANQPLVAGDIQGSGHWLALQYDVTLDKWVLQNPASPAAILPSFSVNRSSGANQTAIASSVATKVQFNGEVFDTNNNFDPVTNFRFTPTVAGKYLISFQTRFNTATDQSSSWASIYKNGSSYAHGVFVQSGATSVQTSTVTCVIDMNGSTDYIEFYVLQDTGSNRDLLGAVSQTFATGAKIS